MPKNKKKNDKNVPEIKMCLNKKTYKKHEKKNKNLSEC